MPPPIELYINDIVQTRKPHPCGGDTWVIVRVGAEIGLRCQTCDHKIFLARSAFERRIKRFITRGNSAPFEEDKSNI